MHASRIRTSYAGEWVMAAAFLIATFAVGSLIVRELRMVPLALAGARDTAPAATSAVPPDAVLVPSLVLGQGRELVVGAPAAELAGLDPAALLVKTIVETGPLGTREIRWYDLAGTKFIVVLEPFERKGTPRVAGIYMQ